MGKINKEYWLVVAAGILSGSIVFGGKVFSNLGLSLYEISLLPFIFAAIILSFFVIFKKEHHFRKEMFGILFLYGLIALIITVAQFGAVVLGVSVAMTVLLLYTQPLWTIIFSALLLKEKVTSKNLISGAIVLLGIFILANPFNGEMAKNWIGILMALIGGISLSGWVIVGSFLSKKGNSPINSLFFGNFFMVVLLLLAYPVVSNVIKDDSLARLSFSFTPIIWLYILIFGIVAGVLAQLFYLYGVKRVPAIEAGIILLLEPISGAILSIIFLGQPITLSIVAGGALILFANYLILTGNKTGPSAVAQI